MNDHCPRISAKCILATYVNGDVHCGASVSEYASYVNRKGLLLAKNISEKVDCAEQKKIKRAKKDIMTSKSSGKRWEKY